MSILVPAHKEKGEIATDGHDVTLPRIKKTVLEKYEKTLSRNIDFFRVKYRQNSKNAKKYNYIRISLITLLIALPGEQRVHFPAGMSRRS